MSAIKTNGRLKVKARYKRPNQHQVIILNHFSCQSLFSSLLLFITVIKKLGLQTKSHVRLLELIVQLTSPLLLLGSAPPLQLSPELAAPGPSCAGAVSAGHIE